MTRRRVDSGVPWLGAVPAHWTVKALKWATPVWRGASPRPIDDPKYFDDAGEYAWVRIEDVTAGGMYLQGTRQKLSELGASLSVRLEPGSFFLSIAGSVGKPCIANIRCCVHDGFVYFPWWKGDPRFLYYIFASGRPYLGLGKLGTQLNLNTDTVGSINIPVPPVDEQRAIADFLDRKTAAIDALIAKKKRLVESLDLARTTRVTDLTTRGMNPRSNFQDSGSEWFGQVPAHWQLCRIKHLLLQGTKNGIYKSEDFYGDTGTPILSMGEAFASPVVSAVAARRVRLSKGDIDKYNVREGDLLFARRSLVVEGSGKCSLVDSLPEEHVFESSIIRARPNRELVLPKYLAYLLWSHPLRAQTLAMTKTVTISGVDGQQVRDLVVLRPPLDEQVHIAETLDAEGRRHSSVKAVATRQLQVLREYRQALITAAVTGQLNVAAQPQEAA